MKYSPSNAGTTWRVIKPEASATQGVYPNPASNSLAITNNEAYTGYVIVDALGKQVQENKSFVPASIDISKLPSGFYTIKATQENGTLFNSKFTKK